MISYSFSSILSNLSLFSSTFLWVLIIVSRISWSFKSYSVLEISGFGSSFATSMSFCKEKYIPTKETTPIITSMMVFKSNVSSVLSLIFVILFFLSSWTFELTGRAKALKKGGWAARGPVHWLAVLFGKLSQPIYWLTIEFIKICYFFRWRNAS